MVHHAPYINLKILVIFREQARYSETKDYLLVRDIVHNLFSCNTLMLDRSLLTDNFVLRMVKLALTIFLFV